MSKQARLSPARIKSILSAVKRIRLGQSLTVKQFQRLLGLMAAASNVIPFGLLYMRPLQWWLRTKGFSPRGNPFRMIKVTPQYLRALVMWKKPWFLSQGPMLGASCCRKMLTTDDSLTGWGVILEGCSSQSLWNNHHLSWHNNCLEMLAVFLALKNFLADLRGHHVLVRSDNTSVVSNISHQGGSRSRPLCKLACQILLWSQGKLLSLRAAYIPGVHNVEADILSRQGLRPGEWWLHPEVVKLIWREFGQAQVDLFASHETVSLSTLFFWLTFNKNPPMHYQQIRILHKTNIFIFFVNCWSSGKYVNLLCMCIILGRGSFCFNYCLNSAQHGGDQFVALLSWYGSPGLFGIGLQLICIFWSLVSHFPLDNSP